MGGGQAPLAISMEHGGVNQVQISSKSGVNAGRQAPLAISMEHCAGEARAAEGAFDLTRPAGAYTLDLSLEYDRVVLRKLVQVRRGTGTIFAPDLHLVYTC